MIKPRQKRKPGRRSTRGLLYSQDEAIAVNPLKFRRARRPAAQQTTNHHQKLIFGQHRHHKGHMIFLGRRQRIGNRVSQVCWGQIMGITVVIHPPHGVGHQPDPRKIEGLHRDGEIRMRRDKLRLDRQLLQPRNGPQRSDQLELFWALTLPSIRSDEHRPPGITM